MSRNVVWIRLEDNTYRLGCLDPESGRAVCDSAVVPVEGEAPFEVPSGWSPAAGIRGAHVVLDIPLKDLHVRFLDLPLADKEKVRGILPFETEGLFLTPLDTMVLDVELLGKKDASTYRYLVVGAEKEVLRAHIERLNAAGLDPDIIGSSDLAVLGAGSAGEIGDRDPMELLTPEIGSDERGAYVRGLVSGGGFTLRRGDLAETEKRREAVRAMRRTGVLALVLLILVAGNWGARLWAVEQRNADLESSIRKVFREIDPESRQVRDEVYQARIAIKNLEERVAALQGVPVLDALMALSQAKKGEPRLLLKELQVREGQITATGTAPSFAAAEAFKDALAGRGFGDARILESAVIQEGTVRFTLALAAPDGGGSG